MSKVREGPITVKIQEGSNSLSVRKDYPASYYVFSKVAASPF